MPAVCSGSRVHPLPCWQPHLLREGWWPYPYMQSQRTAITICKVLYPLHSGSRSSWPQNIRNQALVALTSCFSVLEEVSLTLSLFLLWHSSSVLKFMLANVCFSTAPSLRSSWREGDRKGMQGYLNRLCCCCCLNGLEGKWFELFTGQWVGLGSVRVCSSSCLQFLAAVSFCLVSDGSSDTIELFLCKLVTGC